MIQPTGKFTLRDLQVGQTIKISGLTMKVDTDKKCWFSLKEDVSQIGAPVNGAIQATRLNDGYYVSQLPQGGYMAWDSPSRVATPDFAAVLNCATPGEAKTSGQQIPDRYRVLTVIPDLKVVKNGWIDLPDAYGFVPPVYISAAQCYVNPVAFLNRNPRPRNSFDVSWDGQQYVIKGPTQNSPMVHKQYGQGRRCSDKVAASSVP